MTLRCFLFCTDEGTSDLIRQVLTALAVEAEICSTPSAAVQTVASESFHLVIIDWDQQPEAGMVLHAAQDRKVAERPLTLAIVSDDGSAPKALQAGANSTLRRPLVVSQVTDTLTTARDLLRSRFALAKPQMVAAAASAAPSSLPANLESAKEKTLRAGEFLQSALLNPSGQFVTESETPVAADQSFAEPVDALKDLETVAAAAPPSPPPATDEPKGLEWYLKKKGLQSVYKGAAAAPAPAPTPVPAAAPDKKPELLGYDQDPSQFAAPPPNSESPASNRDTRKEEAALFSYMAGETEAAEEVAPSRFRIGKRAVVAASFLAAIAIVAAPQAPWHSSLKVVVSRGQHALQTWLHPQPVTVVSQAPISHEDFGRAGDEFKLPVAEAIPDATTDPSQIQVLPAVDPNGKKPAVDAGTPDQPQAPADQTTAPTPDASQTPAVQVQENPPTTQPAPTVMSPAALPPTTSSPAPTAVPTTAAPPPTIRTEVPPSLRVPLPSNTAPPVTPAPRPTPSQYVPTTTKVPSSLQSQMTTMVPDASGNKSIDSAMPAIEPVNVPEGAERALLISQPQIGYPAGVKGQQGAVILQVFVGRDGTVQDAKFVQGSLAFARTAIDGVHQWKFKPYTLNGRPVSVQTTLTLKFKSGQ